MRLLIHKTPFIVVKNGVPRIGPEAINYCVILDRGVEISNYNYKISLPKETIIIDNFKRILENDFSLNGKPVNEFKIMVSSKLLLKEIEKMHFKRKDISFGFLDKHELIDELLLKTPLFYNKDSIKESMFLLRVKEYAKQYESISPHNLIDDAKKVAESLERISPLKEFKKSPVFLKIGEGIKVAALKDDLSLVKKQLLIKHYENYANFNFVSYGGPGLYSLKELGLLTKELIDLWM